MDAQRFAEVLAGVQRLTDAEVCCLTTLGFAESDLNANRVPFDWLTDLPNLTSQQKADLLAALPPESAEADWADGLRVELG